MPASLFLFSTMTLADILLEVSELGLGSPRLSSDFVKLTNRAIQQIANRKDWTFMHDRNDFTILSGNTSVSLGATFKKLSDEQSPISFEFGQYSLPVVVMSRERVEQLGNLGWVTTPQGQPECAWPYRVVFMEKDLTSGLWELHIPQQFIPNQNLTFHVSGFYFPPALVLGTDSNAFTNHPNLADAVVNLTKKICYAAVGMLDKNQMQAMQIADKLYQEAFTSALYTDTAQLFQGRSLRM